MTPGLTAQVQSCTSEAEDISLECCNHAILQTCWADQVRAPFYLIAEQIVFIA